MEYDNEPQMAVIKHQQLNKSEQISPKANF